jgi:hypothetical protein
MKPSSPLLLPALLVVGASAQPVLPKVRLVVDGRPVRTEILRNQMEPEIAEPHNLSSLASLEALFAAVGSTTLIGDDWIRVNGPWTGNVEFRLGEGGMWGTYDKADFTGTFKEYDPTDSCLVRYRGIHYIPISKVRYITRGDLDQRGDTVFLYTPGDARLDIPGTLQDCYARLDAELSPREKQSILQPGGADVRWLHFGLGRWIRNKWLHTGNKRILKLFTDRNFLETDMMSDWIVDGYTWHLRGRDLDIDGLASVRDSVHAAGKRNPSP